MFYLSVHLQNWFFVLRNRAILLYFLTFRTFLVCFGATMYFDLETVFFDLRNLYFVLGTILFLFQNFYGVLET